MRRKSNIRLILTTVTIASLAGLILSSCNHLCKECDRQECKICKKGHGVTEGACYACLIEKCEDCSGDPKKCVSCRSYHYYQDQLEKCMRCGFGCQECQNDSSCLKCGFIFKIKNSNKMECRLSVFLLVMILMALIAPCGVVWTITYCLCLKTRPKFDENGNVVIPNIRRVERRFTGKQVKNLPLKKKVEEFLFVYGDNKDPANKSNLEKSDNGKTMMTTDR